MSFENVKSVGIKTLGCRLNRYESDALISRFIKSGRYRYLSVEDSPDILILNSCTVTDNADSHTRYTIRNLAKKHPDSLIVLTGCFAQTEGDFARNIEGVSLVVGNNQKSNLLDIIDHYLNKKNHADQNLQTFDFVSDRKHLLFDYDPAQHGTGRTRAAVKIQDGCDRHCSYCKIPQARGRGISRSSQDILNEIHILEERGFREIVLTGVNLGWWRDTSLNLRFSDLMLLILNSLKKTRLRISSIEPCDVNSRLAHAFDHPLLCKFLHVPMQSGSTNVLRRMKRSYSADAFLRRVSFVKNRHPDIHLGTDVMIGFPDESEEDFQKTIDMLLSLEFATVHPFPFSPRQGTPAALFDSFVPSAVMKQRVDQILAIRKELNIRYLQKFVGQTREAVIEHQRKNSSEQRVGRALTDNYIKLRFPVTEEVEQKRGTLQSFHLIAPDPKGNMQAELLN